LTGCNCGNSSYDKVTLIVRGLTWNAADQAAPLKLDDHLVDRRRRGSEEPLEVGLGWRTSVEQGVRIIKDRY
jgi:hypothetical protein